MGAASAPEPIQKCIERTRPTLTGRSGRTGNNHAL